MSGLAKERWILSNADHVFAKTCVACFTAAGVAAPSPSVVATSITFIDQTVFGTDYLTLLPPALLAAKPQES
jgi:hypothetical protein